MSVLSIILSIAIIVVCVGLIASILMQSKRTSGLGSVAGMGGSQTYWDKNKGRSLEGSLEKYSKIGGALLFVLSVISCIIK